jgi:HPt (histidine-containing phosphotransfer) domain-containing protein
MRDVDEDSSSIAPRSTPPVRQILNLAHLRVFTLGPGVFEDEILGLFLGELPKSMAGLAASVERAEWLAEAHKLRGSALGVGAERLAEAARIAEKLPVSAPDARRTALSELASAIAEVENVISALGSPTK